MRTPKRSKDGVLPNEGGKGILVFGKSPFVVGYAGVFASILALLKISEQQAGDVGIAVGIVRPARQQILWPHGIPCRAPSTQFLDKFALGPSAGNIIAAIPISLPSPRLLEKRVV
jgi:hypothetical protein